MDEKLQNILKIKNRTLAWIVIALLCAVFAFLDAYYNDCLLSGIVLPVAGIFLGPAAILGFTLGTGITMAFWYESFAFFYYVLSALCMSFIPWLLRKHLRDVTNPSIILKYYGTITLSIAFSVAVVLLYCLLPSDDPDIIYHVSVSMEVLCSGYAIGFPLYFLVRSLLDKNLKLGVPGVKMFCLWMPLQFGISFWFAEKAFLISLEPDIYSSLSAVNLVLALFFGIIAVFVFLFSKYKHLMLNIFTLILAASTIYNLVNFDTGAGTYILAVITVWLAVHAIFFAAYEEKMHTSPALKISVRTAQSLLTVLFTLIAALSVAGYAIPLATGEESSMIILGAPVVDNKATEILQDRIDTAADFLSKHEDITVIATGGTKVVGGKTEAQVITDGLIEHGIPGERILQETEAKTTQENFSNCSKLIEQIGGSPNDPTIITTSEFHLLRSGIYAREAGFTDLRYLGAVTFAPKDLTWYIREVIAILPLLF